MKFDYIRIYEEGKSDGHFDAKFRIVFIKNGDRCERIKSSSENSIFYTNSDNTKKYYPQNYKEFLKMLKATEVVSGEIKVYEVYSGCLLSHDYKNKNHCYHQDKTTLNELVNLAKEYYSDKSLLAEKQEQQKNAFVCKCNEILAEKVGIITAESRR